jgi:protein-tyrosine phosphatase
MRKELYWLDGPWRGKLAMAARPRGGDWLPDDLSGWKQVGADTVLSLLTPEEEEDLDLRQGAGKAKKLGLEFASFPIPDRQIPRSEAKWADILDRVTRRLTDGKNVVVHCRRGIGRTGLAAGGVSVGEKGNEPGSCVELVSAARGVAVPETTEQRDWIDHYAVGRSATK